MRISVDERLTRRAVTGTVVAAALVLGAAGCTSAGTSGDAGGDAAGDEGAEVLWNHDPESPIGPAEWGGLDPAWSTCAEGQGQSPVRIADSEPGDLAELQVDYPVGPLVVENVGHTVEVPQDGVGGTLTVDGAAYELLQWHVHAPSEHLPGNDAADLEVHLVHQDDDGGLAVVAVLADAVAEPEADPSGGSPAELLATTIGAAPPGAGEEVDTGQEATSAQLLPANAEADSDGAASIADYWAYSGSLTTPPCTEGVRWFVLSELIEVDADAVDEMRTLSGTFPGYEGYEANARDVQDLNGRTIQSSQPES